MTDNSVLEAVVAKVSDLNDGEMKEVSLVDEANKVLLVKENGLITAIGNKCSHYGAPLKSGVLSNGRVRCPWHGACFNTKTGDIEDYPGLDSIHAFQVSIRGEDVVVTAPASAFGGQNHKRVKSMCTHSGVDSRVFLVVGGGAAGAACVETLRQEGYTGRILLVGKEKYLPYDRIKLSKALSSSPESIQLRPKEFYDKYNIELHLGKEVTELDATTKTARLDDGTVINYDQALVATGGTPRGLPAAGFNDLQNIFQLREPAQANAIDQAVEGKNFLIVGSSFIGMEVAACIVKKAKSVIVIGMEKVPFERVLGEKVGAAMQKLHEQNGVQFRMQRVVSEFKGENGKVSAVVLDNGDVLPAEVCVIGAGVVPATKFLKNVKIERDASVVADNTLKAAEGLYVAGDIARFPYFATGELVRIEHWGMAHFQGALAARNMLAKNLTIANAPFFWTVQFGKGVRYAGHALAYDDVYIDGDLNEFKFAAFYTRAGKVLAVATVGRDPLASAVAELIEHPQFLPSLDAIKAGSVDWVKLTASIH